MPQHGAESALDQQIDVAVAWLERNIAENSDGSAGWGWVPDVPPNPQNTAEVVCVLRQLGRTIPREAQVLMLVRSHAVAHQTYSDWAFRALIDVAWRLRALRCLIEDPHDPDLRACVSALAESQDKETGGWRLAGGNGPISMTATSAAVLALSGLESGPELDIVAAVRRGTTMLVDAMVTGDERAHLAHGAAQIAHVLSLPDVKAIGGPRTKRARERAVAIVLEHLQRGDVGTEEEVFRRGNVTDTWRHLTLHLSLRAVCDAAPERIFEPAFRQGLIHLLELQERLPQHANSGGFRTSREGFVTSYATTQALEVLSRVDAAMSQRVNPGRTFDMLCRLDGAHHSDPQEVLTVGSRGIVLNSWAGTVVMATNVLSGAGTLALALAFQSELGTLASRALVVLPTVFIAIGVYACVATRLPRTSNRVIAATVFSAVTAVILPVFAFLLGS